MRCLQFVKCVQNLKFCFDKSQASFKNKRSKKSGKYFDKQKIVYTNYPCSNELKKEKCINFFDNRSVAVCKENGKKYSISNSDNFDILCIRIDGGVVNDNSCKCDYAIFIKDNVCGGVGRAIFIELKGNNNKHAVEQLIQTIETYKDIGKSYKKVYARVVNSQNVPNIQSIETVIDLKEMLIKLGGNLKFHEKIFHEEYDQLDS